MVKKNIQRLFNVRDGELRISFFMQLYVFLLITVLLMVKPTVTALFLANLGTDNLPYGFILVAITAVVSSHFYNKAIRKFSLRKIIIASLLFFSFSFLLLSIGIHYAFLQDGLLYVYYVLISLFAVITTSQFWILANMVFNSREAKRLFGFIGAGAIAGGIFGGYLTSVIASSLGSKYAIGIAAFFILACIPLMQYIWKLRLRSISVYSRRKSVHLAENSKESAFNLILKSKHLIYIAASVGIGVLVAKLVDYQFNEFAHRLIPNTNELASFFAFWFSTFNVVALLLQLFLTNRILGYLGVTSTLLILPLSIAIGCLILVVAPELWVLVLIKGLDGSLKQSLNKAATELSILPIPFAVKSQTKSFIDVVVDSIATGVAGLTLIFLIKGMELPTIYVTAITLLLLFSWLIMIYKLRETYFSAFRKNLKRFITDDSASKKKKETPLSTAQRVLETGDDVEILSVLDNIGGSKVIKLQQEIITLLDHQNVKIKRAAIQKLYDLKIGTASSKVEELLKLKNDNLVLEAMQYLLNHSTTDESKIFDTYLDHSSSYLANAALLSLAKEAQRNTKLATKYNLRARINKHLDTLSSPEGLGRASETTEMLMTIAHSGLKEFYYYIRIHLYNTNRDILNVALRAAGTTADPMFIEPILEFFKDKELRKMAIKALSLYGPEINIKLIELEKKVDLNVHAKRYLPRVVARFKSKNATRILFKFLKSNDVLTRYEVSKSLQKLKRNNSELKFGDKRIQQGILREIEYYRRGTENKLVMSAQIERLTSSEFTSDRDTDLQVACEQMIALLKKQSQTSFKTLFNLLGLIYNPEDMRTAYLGLMSKTADAQNNAIEFLDNLLHTSLKNKILPTLELAEISSKTILSPEILTNDNTAMIKALKVLFKTRGKAVKISGLYIISALQDKRCIPLVKPLTTHQDEDIKKLSNSVLELLSL